MMSSLTNIPAHEFLEVGRSPEIGLGVVGVVAGTFGGNLTEKTKLVFHNKETWQRAWRLSRVVVSHGFDVLPEEAFL